VAGLNIKRAGDAGEDKRFYPAVKGRIGRNTAEKRICYSVESETFILSVASKWRGGA
jgi:hypothetical protein